MDDKSDIFFSLANQSGYYVHQPVVRPYTQNPRTPYVNRRGAVVRPVLPQTDGVDGEIEPLLPPNFTRPKALGSKTVKPLAFSMTHYLFNWCGTGDYGTAGWALYAKYQQCTAGCLPGYFLLLEVLNMAPILIHLLIGLLGGKDSAVFTGNPLLALARTHHGWLFGGKTLGQSIHIERKNLTSTHMPVFRQIILMLVIGGLEAGFRTAMAILRMTSRPSMSILVSCGTTFVNHLRMSAIQFMHKYKSMKHGSDSTFLVRILFLTLLVTYVIPVGCAYFIWLHKYGVSREICPRYNGSFYNMSRLNHN